MYAPSYPRRFSHQPPSHPHLEVPDSGLNKGMALGMYLVRMIRPAIFHPILQNTRRDALRGPNRSVIAERRVVLVVVGFGFDYGLGCGFGHVFFTSLVGGNQDISQRKVADANVQGEIRRHEEKRMRQTPSYSYPSLIAPPEWEDTTRSPTRHRSSRTHHTPFLQRRRQSLP